MLRGQVILYPIIYAFCPIISLCRRWMGHDSLDGMTLALLVLLMLLEAVSQTVFSK